jgi:deazaflavin-dependent oxidoreductase (nitroreductase family)
MPLVEQPAPSGLLRLCLRLPVWLYRLRCGWVLKSRFLLLTHIGRQSGLPRQTVLEVVHHDRAPETYVIASGWGKKSDWFRNLQKTPAVVVTVGGRRFAATARCLSGDEAARVLLVYAQQHRRAFRALAKLMVGQRLHGTEQDCRLLARSVPLVALQAGRVGE